MCSDNFYDESAEVIAKELVIAYVEENKPEEFKDPLKAAELIVKMYNIILDGILRECCEEECCEEKPVEITVENG
ncbi:MAG: hypothetical protein WC364_02355 [Eubacteriales bacterium]|jgi:hypothetical protein